ncbi:MAG: 4-hydroxy-3-methylbut-2-enyl diphosphate reductase [Lachnospira sp.]|jgi:4-hydroxy-3-methylbut-2-enyl diphosphate reductase
MKEVILAKSAGFCFGVKRAMDTVYEQTGKKNVYTFGPIIHNEEVVKDLEKKGVFVINTMEELDDITEGTVIIRSHGVSSAVYEALRKKGVEIVDATCPFVLKIHNIVKQESANGKQIVIIGNEKHPEVEGIMGWSKTQVHVVDTVEKAQNLQLDPQREVCIVSQTTFNYNKFKELVEIISEKGYNIIIRNTICNATEERQTEAREIAKRVDAMIVVGGSSSSNTRKLYEICKNECKDTYYIQTLNDLDMTSLGKADCIGITAGASTPNNIIQEVYTNVRTEL